jgi:hypothetical protein
MSGAQGCRLIADPDTTSGRRMAGKIYVVREFIQVSLTDEINGLQ